MSETGDGAVEAPERRRRRPQRSWLAVGLLVAVLAVAGLAVVLSWRQYDEAQDRAVREQRTRAVLAADLLNTFVSGQIATLTAVAASPDVMRGDVSAMQAYFAHFRAPTFPQFSGGVGWIDLTGIRRANSEPGAATLNADVSDRSFYREVVRTGKPFVSEGIVTRVSRLRVVVVAVPTRDANGALTGVLAGALEVKPSKPSRASLDLGFAGTNILDRNGVSLLRGFQRPKNAALVARLKQARTDGVIRSGPGLEGGSDHVVAYAAASLPGWTIVLDRPASEVFASARHQVELDLGLIAFVAAAAIALIAAIVIRTRRMLAREFERAHEVDELTQRLTRASVVRDVSEALGTALQRVFPTAGIAVGWVPDDQLGIRTGWLSRTFAWPRRGEREALLTEAADVVFAARTAVTLPYDGQLHDRLPSLPEALRGVAHSAYIAPLATAEGRQLGAVLILRPETGELDGHLRELIASHADQAAGAFERARRYEREHEVAVRLQRGLLPERLPSVTGLDLAARYQAGTAALEIGGDWYDVVRRADGIVHVIIGDVAGRGLGAAMVMGELRTAFRAYSFDYTRPADVMRHLCRHVPRDEMVTAVCLAMDPYTSEVRFVSAGHPPGLLLGDDDGLGVTRFAEAATPPLGFVDPARIEDERMMLRPGTTAVLYTDGLVERRGRSIDEGIARVATTIADRAWRSASELGDAVLEGLEGNGDRQDDIALLIVRVLAVPDTLDIGLPADPRALGEFRRRVRAWLDARGLTPSDREDAVLAASEACNNAIEHGYAERDGEIRVRIAHADGVLEIAVTDGGSWREPSEDPSRGRGISIMERLADDVALRTTASGTVVMLRLRLETKA